MDDYNDIMISRIKNIVIPLFILLMFTSFIYLPPNRYSKDIDEITLRNRVFQIYHAQIPQLGDAHYHISVKPEHQEGNHICIAVRSLTRFPK